MITGTEAQPLLDLPTAQVGPIPFRVATLDRAKDAVLQAAASLGARDNQALTGVAVHFANAYTVALADADAQYAELFREPQAAVFSDGMPVAWFGRRLHPQHAQSWERVYGPDVMTATLTAAQPAAVSHYLLGGSPQALQLLADRIAFRFPAARIVGMESPPFRELTAEEVAAQDARIRMSGASIVWVGLGTPKQDWEVSRLAAALPVVSLAVGAAFDFLAGTKAQAPLWMQRSGTEWAFRLASEPRRLARRYLWGNPRFVRAASRGKVKELRGGPQGSAGESTHAVKTTRPRPRVLEVAPAPRWEAGPVWPPRHAERAAVLAHFSEDAQVSRSVSTYVDQLAAHGYQVLVMSAASPRGPLQWPQGLPDGVSVYRRPNIGYDFGSWAAALASFPDIAEAPRVLLTNDSMLGPFAPITELLEHFERGDAGLRPVWGLVGSEDRSAHLQSHTVGYRDGVLATPSLRDFWADIRVLPSKQSVIDRYELGLARVLRGDGLEVDVAYPSSLVVPPGVGSNPTGQGWRRLLSFGFPFVKRELVTAPRWFIPDAEDVASVVRDRFGTDVEDWL